MMKDEPPSSGPAIGADISAQPSSLQDGTVCRLELALGFGYVRDAADRCQYVFLLGKAIRNRDVVNLRVGSTVKFRVEGQGRVTELFQQAACRPPLPPKWWETSLLAKLSRWVENQTSKTSACGPSF